MSSERILFLDAIDGAAIREKLDGWRSAFPEMGALALLPESEKDHIPALQALFTEKGIPLMGAVFPGLLAKGRFRYNGIILLRLDERPFSGLYALNIPADSLQSRIKEISKDVKRNIDKPRDSTLFMIFDAMVPNIATILDNLYLELADEVHYMGINAGSETFKPMPCLFDNAGIIGDGVLIILMKRHPGAILEHGYSAPPQMITATSTDGNRIISIDWRPAFEVYQEMAKAQYGVTVNKENFYQYGVRFPFGIMRADGEILVRIPVAMKEDGSIFCVGEIPPNSILALLSAPEVNSLHTVGTLAEGLNTLCGTTEGREIPTFYCAGRLLYLGRDKAEKEIQDLSRFTGAAEIAGALSLGEIGSSKQWGYPLFHNATLVSCPWWEK